MNPSATPSAVPDAAAPKKRRRFLLGLLGLVVLGVVVAAVWYQLVGRWVEQTNDAYVQGNQVSISPRLAGTVVAIMADDGMRVERGQLLVQLDAADSEVALQQAQANLARAVRQVRGLYRSVDAARAELNARQVALRRVQADVARRRNLAEQGAIAQEELAHVREELAVAQAAQGAAREALAASRALVDGTEVATHPDVLGAAAQVRQAFLDHARTAVVAPVAGVVARRSVQVGQRVQPGMALMALVPTEQMWVEANFKETQLRHMRLGQDATVRADVYGSAVTFDGRIDSLGLGTGAAFSLLPAQNASGNWIKIVQRVPVRIRLDAAQLAQHPLRLGLSMSVSVSLRDQRGGVLPAAVAGFDAQFGAGVPAVYATDVYAGLPEQAEALIARIIQDNLPQ